MSNVDIRVAFETRLKAWADSRSPKLKIAYQNIAFTKPDDGSPFLECFLIPNTTQNREVSAKQKTFLGMFQVNVWVLKNKGMREAELIADSLRDLFPVVPKMGGLSVESPASVGRPVPDDSGWYILPILVNYRFET